MQDHWVGPQSSHRGPQVDRTDDRSDAYPSSRQGHLYVVLSRPKAESLDDVITGMILISHQPTFILFYPGSTYSTCLLYTA